MEELEKKHPSAAEIREECLLNGPIDQILPNIFDLINEQMIYDAALKTKGSAGPSVGEVLRRIIGKTTTLLLKEEVKSAAGPLQVCAGHSAGAEAAIHTMSQVFDEEETDGILLIDATNAFNQMSRAVHT